jgi:hypothetical protein
MVRGTTKRGEPSIIGDDSLAVDLDMDWIFLLLNKKTTLGTYVASKRYKALTRSSTFQGLNQIED